MKKLLLIIFITSFVSTSCKKKKAETKALWILNAFNALEYGYYPNVKAVAWWNENFKNNFFNHSKLRIDSSPQALEAYQNGFASPTYISTPIFNNQKLIAPTNGIYHSAYPDFGGTEDEVSSNAIIDFENLAKKKIVWAYFSNNWMDNIRFPSTEVNTILNSGKVPFIRMMPRSTWNESQADPKYTLQKIINGDFDTQLNQWAIDAKNTNTNLLVEFGTEINGNWFPWNGEYNGGSETNGYGNQNLADGPERFVDAYKHIIDICNQNGATNITWFFHADSSGEPNNDWNKMENYYPGDKYIDWIGVSVYGPQTRKDDNEQFKDKLDKIYTDLTTMSNNPIAILEFGVTEYK
jgi:beta-mannanase